MGGGEVSPGSAAATSGLRWLAALGLVGVVLLAVLPFLADLRSEARVPKAEDLAGAIEAIRGAFEEGDAVYVEPTWWTVPYQGLVGVGPGTTAWPFPALLGSEELDPVEALGHGRVIVLAGFGREASLPAAIAEAGREGRELFRSDTVAATAWTVDQAKRLRSVMAEWETLTVERRHGPGEPKRRCPLRDGRHRCGREGWLDVGPEAKVVGHREVYWLFIHPGPRGTSLEMTWSRLPTRSERGETWLYVRVGPSLQAVGEANGGPVLFETLVDGEVVDRVEVAPRTFAMERRAVRLAAVAPDKDEVAVVFRVSTEDPAWRETLFTADLLDHLPPSLERWATGVVGR